jgi:hypothetical protein
MMSGGAAIRVPWPLRPKAALRLRSCAYAFSASSREGGIPLDHHYGDSLLDQG